MFELTGRFGTAKVFTDICDESTVSQVVGILNNPISENQQVRIMSDCHAGNGCVVGTTMTIGSRVSPNTVGVDIGCGMLIVNLGKLNIDFKEFDRACHEIPSGHDVWLDKENRPAGLFRKYFGISAESFLDKFICRKSLKDLARLQSSLGSLGGGNHFIELDKDDEGFTYLVIHTGSRGLGKQVCDYYQELAYKDMNDHSKELDKLISDLKREGRVEEINDAIKAFTRSQIRLPKDDAYLEGEHLEAYLHDMKLSQEFATMNRRIIATEIIKRYFKDQSFGNDRDILARNFEWFETIHNYINFNDKILRKGAVSAREGEILIIPMNMRDGSLICRGKGNPDWNYSAPHGAGRILSRSEAKELLTLEEYEEEMKGIYSTSVLQSTLDESPMAYKPMESILKNIKDTVDVIKIIKPIYNFKASEGPFTK